MLECALISDKHMEGNCRDFHLFLSPNVTNNYDGSINIDISNVSECGEKAKTFNFRNLKYNNFTIAFNNKAYYYEFYRNEDCSVYYFKGDVNARITIAAFLGIRVCGNCVSFLYNNNLLQ